MSEKSAIIGLHGNELMALSLEGILGRRGYSKVEMVKTPEAMITKCGERDYSLYIMDVNLGFPEGYDFSCAHQVYKRIKPKVDSGEVKFFPIAAFEDVVETAKRDGLPALTKTEFNGRYEELFGAAQRSQS